MNFKYPNTKNLMSKDFNVTNKECKRILDECDLNVFSDLCENSEFIFDFIKTKINKNFLNNVNENNYLNLLELAKIYSEDFEEFIVMGLVKFANEDLTDTILALFEKGEDNQKTYLSKYFCYIQDPLSLEYLREFALSDFTPLSYNSILALKSFNDRTLYDKEIEILKGDYDDFEKVKAVSFLSAYGDLSSYNLIYDYMKRTPFTQDVIEALLTLKPLFETDFDKSLIIYNSILDLYPEFISLETVIPYEIKDFIKRISNKEKTKFISYLLYKSKIKFNLIGEDDIYIYDLDKDTKSELKEIVKILNQINVFEDDFKGLLKDCDDKIKENILDTITDENLKTFKDEVKELLENTQNEILIYKSLNALKTFGEILPQDIIQKIKNENIKALIESLY